MTTISPQQETHYRAIDGWDQLIHLTPEDAASVMSVIRGTPVLAREAEYELRRAKRQARSLSEVEDTVADFQRDSLGKAHAAQYGGSVSTTRLYKLISNKPG